MKKVGFFKARKRLRNGEYFSFIGGALVIINVFKAEQPDRPSEIGVDTSTTLLDENIHLLTSTYDELNDTLNVNRKLLETEEMQKTHLLRIGLFSSIKKRIIALSVNLDNKANVAVAASVLKNIIVFYVLGAKTKEDVSGLLTNIINILKSNEHKEKSTLLNLTDQITQLETANNKYIELSMQRSSYLMQVERSARPARLKCDDAYDIIVDTINSMIVLNNDINFDTLINDLNGLNEHYQILLNSHSKTNKKEDRPEVLAPPLITGPVE